MNELLAMSLSYVTGFCQAIVSLAFAISFAGKALHMPEFTHAVTTFAILPAWASKPAAYLLLTAEFATALLVIAGGPLLNAGLVMATALLLVFSFALLSVLRRNMRISCNCFGPSHIPVSRYDVWRNAGLIVICLAGLAATSLANNPQRSLDFAGWSIAALAASVTLLLLVRLGDIAQLFRQS